jgi:hypothetical protein
MDTNPQAKLVIHRGTDRPGRYAWSPFVTKLEVRYRLSDLPYTCGVGGPIAAPNGKVSQPPYSRRLVAKHLPDPLGGAVRSREGHRDPRRYFAHFKGSD